METKVKSLRNTMQELFHSRLLVGLKRYKGLGAYWQNCYPRKLNSLSANLSPPAADGENDYGIIYFENRRADERNRCNLKRRQFANPHYTHPHCSIINYLDLPRWDHTEQSFEGSSTSITGCLTKPVHFNKRLEDFRI